MRLNFPIIFRIIILLISCFLCTTNTTKNSNVEISTATNVEHQQSENETFTTYEKQIAGTEIPLKIEKEKGTTSSMENDSTIEDDSLLPNVKSSLFSLKAETLHSSVKEKNKENVISNTSEDEIAIENESNLLKPVASLDENSFHNQKWPKDSSVETGAEKNTASTATDKSLPDMLENPTTITLNEVTSTELPIEVFEQHSIESVILSSSDDLVNNTVDFSIGIGSAREETQTDQIQKINDSGGKIPPRPPEDNMSSPPAPPPPPSGDGIIINIPMLEQQQQQHQQQNASTITSTITDDENLSPDVNLTAEEVPIPVFSEWAQKQMEAAEKKLEQEVVNSSAQKKNTTNGSKQSAIKLRTKNYASPDCGAKIISSNFDAQNTGALLTSSKDEYMLSPCTNRIWFVVELCEAVQAEKIDLANFELFSSSPKNFSVAVSNRFPTREWSNVGRFIAEDKRNIQSFDLHPHLFGKFVRVDIHSHYNSEHFCPVSLFRVYGTSEFEAFETENRLADDIDEYEDDVAFDQAAAAAANYKNNNNDNNNNNNNLFKSASDAVLSIVKKAAEALVKTNPNRTNSDAAITHESLTCLTPYNGEFTCSDCNTTLVTKINHALSCKHFHLMNLLNIDRLRNDILASNICAKQFSLDMRSMLDNSPSFLLNHKQDSLPYVINVKQSYFLNLLPNDYIGALCQLLAATSDSAAFKFQTNTDLPILETKNSKGNDEEIALNLTIDKKIINAGDSNQFNTLDNTKKPFGSGEIGVSKQYPSLSREEQENFHNQKDNIDSEIRLKLENETTKVEENASQSDDDRITAKLQHNDQGDHLSSRSDENIASNESQSSSSNPPSILDINIYNLPKDQQLEANVQQTAAAPAEIKSLPPSQDNNNKLEQQTTDGDKSGNGFESFADVSNSAPIKYDERTLPEDSASWENLDNLLSEAQQSPTTPTIISGNGNSYPNTKVGGGPHSESVFIRLSNRIKALERNMSLSGQYLEELSKRYKKHVEELQQSLTKTARALEEQNRRHSEQEQYLMLRNSQLQNEIDDLSLQIHACIVLIICVGTTVFILFVVGILFYRAIIRRQANSLLNNSTTIPVKRNPCKKTLDRRKSFEDYSDHKSTITKPKIRRPSEEAMIILKECDSNFDAAGGDLANEKKRQRKISVFYGNGIIPKSNTKRNNRKLEKKSRTSIHCNKLDVNTPLSVGDNSMVQKLTNGGNTIEGQIIRDKKKSLPISWYQQQCLLSSGDNVASHQNLYSSYDDEKAALDEDDTVNFLPGSDLAYNEFMPDGPSGYTIVNSKTNGGSARTPIIINSSSSEKSSASSFDKKFRRLSSPAFFKSPFSRNSKSKTTPSHQSTSWEWYRLKKSDSQKQQQQQQESNAAVPCITTTTTTTTTSTTTSHCGDTIANNSENSSQDQIKLNNGFGGINRPSPTESSSLSEILSLSGHNGSSSTGGSIRGENPYRTLEEAIISSATSPASTASATSIRSTNGNCNSSSSGGSSNNSSKKRRTFNRIFKKVF